MIRPKSNPMSDKNSTVRCVRPACNKEIPAALAVYVQKEPYCPGECEKWIREFSRKMALLSNPPGHITTGVSGKFKSKKLNSALNLKPTTKYPTHL